LNNFSKILFGILVDMDALPLDKSPDFYKKKKKLVLVANVAIILFGEIPQLIIYVTYIKFQIKPVILPIIVLSSCLIVLIFKLIFNKILVYIFQIIVSLIVYLFSSSTDQAINELK
jgi:hypothetical protein